jgi:tetratricopeptide (TPR) repeat protein
MGVTHRDVKPSNFLITRQNGKMLVKLTDMGLARTAGDDEFRVTKAGTTVGTIDYMSPEQARDSGLADIRSDIYSLGCTLYHMLTGQPPFPDGGLGERIYNHQMIEPVDVRQHNRQVTAELWAVLQRMLAKKPEDRYQTPAELLRELKRIPAQEEGVTGTEAPAPDWAREAAPTRVQPAVPDPATPTPAPRRKPRRAAAPPRPGPAPEFASSAEHRLAAAGQFERAREVLATGNEEYGVKLLLSCCKLDPTNLLYRRTLRQVERGSDKRGWLGRLVRSLGTLVTRAQLKAALRMGEYLKVLEYGEQVLLRRPDDVPTHLDMAAAADQLDLEALAVWVLEEARERVPDNTAVQRGLAQWYERQNRFAEAIALWERVRKAEPHDPEVQHKIKNLAASDTIARGNYLNQ